MLTKDQVLDKFLESYGLAIEKHHRAWCIMHCKDRIDLDYTYTSVVRCFNANNRLNYVSEIYSYARSDILDDLIERIKWIRIEIYDDSCCKVYFKKIENPLLGCETLEEACIRLDLVGSLKNGEQDG